MQRNEYSFTCESSDCYSHKGDLKFEGRDMRIYGWSNTGNTLYLAGKYHNSERPLIRAIDLETFQTKDNVLDWGLLPISIEFTDKGLSITEINSKGTFSNSIMPYYYRDKDFQIKQVLKKYDLTKTSDQIALGERYLNGDIVDKNEKKAVELFEKASSKNNPYALYRLGYCLRNGRGVDKNVSRAFSLFEKSANLGNKDAMNSLSEMYVQGEGTEKNMPKAMFWKEKIAFNGDKNAQEFVLANQSTSYEKVDMPSDTLLNLARQSFNNRNYKWAQFCYKRAIDLGNTSAMYEYGKNLYEGAGIEKNVASAIDVLAKAGESGDVKTQKFLAKIYDENKGITPNVEKRVYWLQKAASKSDAESQFELSKAYESGIGVKRNKKMSLQMLTNAGLGGNTDAIMKLTCMYGDKKKVEETIHWFKMLDIDNQRPLADKYAGIKGKKYEQIAFNMWKILADKNDFEGLKHAAICYTLGRGVDVDLNLAQEYRWKIDDHPDMVWAKRNSVSYYLMGLYHEKKGKIQNAMNCYKNSSEKEAKERYEELNNPSRSQKPKSGFHIYFSL